MFAVLRDSPLPSAASNPFTEINKLLLATEI